MKTTITLATNLNVSPFEVFDRDTDEIIMLINFYIDLGVSNDGEIKVENNSVKDNDKAFWAMI